MAQGIVPRVRSATQVAASVAVLLLLPLVATAASTTPDGIWVGEMKRADGEEFSITLTLDGMGTRWSGTIEDPYMGEIELEDLSVTATRISFTFRPPNVPYPANFLGSYIAGKDRITGTFSLRGTSRFVKFERSAEGLDTAMAEPEEPAAPSRVRHGYRFALAGRAGWWAALHLVKDENYNINNLTKSRLNWDAGAKWFARDEFSITARYYRGGLDMTDDQGKISRYEDIGLTSDSFLKLDGWEIALTGYLGNVMMRESRFNPYLTAGAGLVSWELSEGERGTDPLAIDRFVLQGDDLAVMFGLGTEYALGSRVALEFEVAWRYFMTGDEDKWADPDDTWSNTHAWGISLGLLWGIW